MRASLPSSSPCNYTSDQLQANIQLSGLSLHTWEVNQSEGAVGISEWVRETWKPRPVTNQSQLGLQDWDWTSFVLLSASPDLSWHLEPFGRLHHRWLILLKPACSTLPFLHVLFLTPEVFVNSFLFFMSLCKILLVKKIWFCTQILKLTGILFIFQCYYKLSWLSHDCRISCIKLPHALSHGGKVKAPIGFFCTCTLFLSQSVSEHFVLL